MKHEQLSEQQIPDDLKLPYRWWQKDRANGKEYTVPTAAGMDLIERIAKAESKVAELEAKIAQARKEALETIAQEAGRKSAIELFSFLDINFKRGRSYANSREETIAIVIEQNIRALIAKELANPREEVAKETK